MLGHLYDRALGGERCWIRHEDGEIRVLPAHRWLGARCLSNGGPADAPDEVFDEAVTQMCSGPTIELGCGPGRLVARLFERGIPALGIDRSATVIRLARRGGAPALLSFDADAIGIRARWVRLESTCDIGPWFRWASVGAHSAATLAGQVGLTLTSVRLISGRVIASLAAP
jgi:SAM-dependent methyltransferase